ncbi:hypothetical protein [Pontibacter akesuensis]|uniref:Uncharacterized protein n=1 Tax=Pontibacter akesuensis TaxID=388950 RepID=A0A1I7J5S9_9BACT|nr:hypothetical protein [Pontibacter akesuensis]GHA72256.1 hypothetical protein GCM10007389_27460 [Pontibacter akesuensis]SFU80528.1 hypothetical protein SAMN04487941_2517 [Pontibacter akesuensis]
MKNKDGARTTKRDGDSLGNQDSKKKVSDNPSQRGTGRESENTPPENEVYVNLEPDELHLSDEEKAINVSKGKKKKEDK